MVERIVFNGYTYRRYPNSKNPSDRHYFKRSSKEKAVYLHREVWKSYFGDIPEGCHIHHKDGDTGNNQIENLECVSSKEHCEKHPFSEERLQWQKDHLEGIRHLTKAWHASEEGREKHREIGGLAYKNYVPVEKECQWCGKLFFAKAIGGRDKFCSNNCKSASRRASGVDNETRICIQCGNEFTVNKYSKTKYCSRACVVNQQRQQQA